MQSTSALYETTLRSIAGKLLHEAGYSTHGLQHADTSEVRRIVNHLLVIRPAPDQVDEDEEVLYKQMDQVLQLEQTRTPLVSPGQLPTISSSGVFSQMVLWKGDITALQATAIVNAANSALLGCFQPPHRCIDNVIHCKAGPRLRTACAEIMSRQGHQEPVGSAKITPAFALPSSYVIHTVGPALRRGQQTQPQDRDQLQSCYTSSLDLLLKTVTESASNGDPTTKTEAVTIAFPCISTGLFAFPSEEAAPLAITAVKDWLDKHHAQTRNWKVIFNTFLQKDYDLYKAWFETNVPGVTISPPGPDASLLKALRLLQDADYLMVSAGAGLSAAAGLDYTSKDVMKKFHPNVRKVLPTFKTMYNSIGYSAWHPELMWGYLFKQISMVRFGWPKHRTAPTYANLRSIYDAVGKKHSESTYVVTSNADGMFEQEGFPVDNVCLMQGEYGRIQCRRPCTQQSVWDVRPFMEKALESFNEETYEIEDWAGIPKCPNCQGDMFLLLRIDGSFLESALKEGKKNYRKWLATALEDVRSNGKKLVILEVGVGFNTPGVLRIPNEELAMTQGVDLIRVNSEHPELPFESNGVGLAMDANAVLEFLAHQL